MPMGGDGSCRVLEPQEGKEDAGGVGVGRLDSSNSNNKK